MAKVTMPQLGESVAEGTIGKWLKQPGDHVAKYEPLLEVITDKVNAEVPSPFEGTLREILVDEGATVPNNAEIAVIETADEGAGTAAAEVPADAAKGPSGGVKSPSGGIASEPSPPSATPEPAPAGVQAIPGTSEAHGPAGSDERPVRGERRSDEAPAAAATEPAPGADGRSSRDERAAAATAAPPSSSGPVPVMEETSPVDARMTPAVRRLLREHGISAAGITGTGGGGRITREDVLRHVEQLRTGTLAAGARGSAAQAGAPKAPQVTEAVPTAAPSAAPAATPAPAPTTVTPAPSFPPGADEELVPFNQMRRGIANQMVKAAAVPTAYTTFECDMTPVVRAREANKAAYQAREGVSLSFVPYVIKAVVEALKRHPDVNAHYTEQGLLRKRRINIGVAVAVENGLIVPVIHDADQLSINGLNRAVQDVAARARTNKLRLDDLQGGTFTVDNTGWFGSIASQPIINVPEVCILTMEAIVKRPIVRETADGEVIAVRSMMNISTSFDHRATDGAQIGRFVQDVIRWLEAVGPDTPIW